MGLSRLRRRKRSLKLLTAAHFQSTVDININTPEVNMSLLLPSSVPMRPRSVCVRRAETVKVCLPLAICKTKTERIEHIPISLCYLATALSITAPSGKRCAVLQRGFGGPGRCRGLQSSRPYWLRYRCIVLKIDSLALIVELQRSPH